MVLYIVTEEKHGDGETALPHLVKKKVDEGYYVLEVKEVKIRGIGTRYVWVLNKGGHKNVEE